MSMLRTGLVNIVISLAAVASFVSGTAIAREQPAVPADAKVFVAPLTATNCATYCAVVNSDGSLARGHAFTTSTHLQTGEYQVLFNTTLTVQKNISKCVWLATPGYGTFGGSQGATFVTTAGRVLTTNGVYVATYNQAGAPADAPFLLEVSC